MARQDSEKFPLSGGGPPKKRQRSSDATGGSSKPISKPQRLQRVLAAAGYGSRRMCEELILEGRVEIDGETVTELGVQVDPKRSEIHIDGTPVRAQRLVYFVLNKPPGVVTTNRDPQGRTRVIDLIQERERVFPVGRLDRNSEGLILLTNDGELAQQLAHPKYGIQKVYRVTVAGKIDSDKLAQMRKGIYIAEGRVAVDGAKIIRHRAKSTDLEILLREGKNREIRRILARLGHKVLTLQRIAIGPLRLGELPRGLYRAVTPAELKRLREDVFRQSRAQKKDFEGDGEEGERRVVRGKNRDASRTPQKPRQRPPMSGAVSSDQRGSQGMGKGVGRGIGKGLGKGGLKRGAKPERQPRPPKFNLEGSQTLGTVIGDPDSAVEGQREQKRVPRKGKKKGAVGNRREQGGRPSSGMGKPKSSKREGGAPKRDGRKPKRDGDGPARGKRKGSR